MFERVLHGRALETAVSHAVVAPCIPADAIPAPVRVFDQRAVTGSVSLVGHEVTRPLPAEDVVGRVAPGRALIGLIAGQEVEKQARVIESPAPPALPAAPEDLAKQALARGASEEYVVTRSVLVVIAGRDRDPLDTESRGEIEEPRDFIGFLAGKQRAVDGHAEIPFAQQANGRDRLVEYAGLAHGAVVVLPIAVEMDGECQVR